VSATAGTPAVTVHDVIGAAAREYGVTRERLTGPQPARRIAGPRHVAMWVAYERFGHTKSHIARVLLRDHTTVMHGIREIDAILGRRDAMAAAIRGHCERIEADIRGRDES